jgi:electron transfer flavoprotein alpha subunit
MSGAVVVCSWGRGRDGLPAGIEEALTVGRNAGAALGSELVWTHVGAVPERASEIGARFGVTAVDAITGAGLDAFAPDVWVEAMAQYTRTRAPRLMLLAQAFDARVVAPRLAARLAAGVVMNGLAIERDAPTDELRVTASAYGGDTRVVYALAAGRLSVVGLLTNAIVAAPSETAATAPPVREVPIDTGGVRERIRVVARTETRGPRVEDAEIIVAGGRGLGTPENFRLVEELARALGGMAAASRPIVDDGWADPSRQVGLTGKITRPALYVAAGISGASQHMVGCSAAKTIVAINRDPDAAIFRYARFGVVGDCVEILPELVRAVKA